MTDGVVRGWKTAQDLAGFESKLEPGDILLATPQPSKARSVLRRTFDRTFAHASSALQNSDKTHSLLYTGDGKIVETRIGLGAKHIPLKRAIRGLDVTALRAATLSREERQQAAQAAIHIVRTKPQYAMKGILKALIEEHDLKIPIGDIRGHICSDIITKSFDKPIVDKPRDAVLPVDFLRSTKLMRVADHFGAKR